MNSIVDIILTLDVSEDDSSRKRALAKKLRIDPKRIQGFRLVKHSIDARKPVIKVHLRFEVGLDKPLEDKPLPSPLSQPLPAGAQKVIVVGSGPAGLFAALKLIERGFQPIILERGKDASARRFDLAPILRQGKVIEDSNYCFGEGGAGTFSDGKLYTRATKRGPVQEVYQTLVAHGAPPQILTDAHPHIGSNLLPNVVKAIRETIIQNGGEVHFESKVVDLLIQNQKMGGVLLSNGEEIHAEHLILATGHSARDIYELLDKKGILLEQKAFAVGMRIEHPQPLIDEIQYHFKGQQKRPQILPAARYRLATKIEDRGVHSFCMCPGGFIVPAATSNDEVVVNGMSLARRDSPFANSGLVVTVEPSDTKQFVGQWGRLSGIGFQKHLEQTAKKAGGGGQVAPGQRVLDFMNQKVSGSLPETSYFPGLTSAPIHELLPDFCAWRMQKALKQFGKSMKGYLTEEALFIGFETRTSSPLRIPREEETLMHPEVQGLYPCGEGAGFAGGIVSAALDGMRCGSAV